MIGASFGAEFEDSEPSSFLYSDTVEEKKEKTYAKPWMVDPKNGGEVTPAYGEGEINMLPINLGYSIIDSEE